METSTHTPDCQELIGPAHHQKVEKLLAQLCEQAGIDDPQGLCDFWSRFERELTAHLDEEEAALIPAFAIEHPEEAAGLLREHAEIRKQLEELGVGVELRVVSPAIAEDLARRLRGHAQREDRILYPWAASHAW